MKGASIFAVLAIASACGRPHAEQDTVEDARPGSFRQGAANSPSAAAVVGRSADGASATGPDARADTPSKWHGSYNCTSGELYIPPDWKNVHWNVKESTAGLGEGAMALSIEPKSGRALGSMEGPLGPAIVDGLVSEGKLTATILRKDPVDQGFTGTLIGSINGAHAEGTMSLSLAEASAVRKATFTLTSETSGAAP